jgi:hypothetical protein
MVKEKLYSAGDISGLLEDIEKVVKDYSYKYTDWETRFLVDIKNKISKERIVFNQKQFDCLQRIYGRVVRIDENVVLETVNYGGGYEDDWD